MNKNRKYVLIAASVVMALMLFFPPFIFILENGTYSAGYHFIGDGPGMATVNVPLLLTQWVAVGVVACIAYIVVKDEEKK